MIAESALAGETIALAGQEEDLLEAMVREHSRLIYRIAYSVVRTTADAEDVTQEVFLRALRQERKVTGKSLAQIDDVKAWLARVTWRVAVEHRQRAAKLMEETEPRIEQELVAPTPHADRTLIEQERNTILEKMIAALPDSLRDPLILSALEEVSPREVAAMLSISEAAVRSRAFRAREILRDKLLALIGPEK